MLAERHRVPVGDGKVDKLFTQPDAIRRALREGTITRKGQRRPR
jgi:hypothetical protein